MVREAERLGFKAIAVTVDAPLLGKIITRKRRQSHSHCYCTLPSSSGIREGDEKNKFSLPSHLKLAVLEEFSDSMKVLGKEGSGLFEMFKDQID